MEKFFHLKWSFEFGFFCQYHLLEVWVLLIGMDLQLFESLRLVGGFIEAVSALEVLFL